MGAQLAKPEVLSGWEVSTGRSQLGGPPVRMRFADPLPRGRMALKGKCFVDRPAAIGHGRQHPHTSLAFSGITSNPSPLALSRIRSSNDSILTSGDRFRTTSASAR